MPGLHIAQASNKEQLVNTTPFPILPVSFSLYYLREGGEYELCETLVCNWRHNLNFDTFATASDTRKMKVSVDVQLPNQVPDQV